MAGSVLNPVISKDLNQERLSFFQLTGSPSYDNTIETFYTSSNQSQPEKWRFGAVISLTEKVQKVKIFLAQAYDGAQESQKKLIWSWLQRIYLARDNDEVNWVSFKIALTFSSQNPDIKDGFFPGEFFVRSPKNTECNHNLQTFQPKLKC